MTCVAGRGWTMHLGDCLDILPTLDVSRLVLVSDVPYGIALSSGRGGGFGRCTIANDGDTSMRDAALELYGPGPAIVFGTWRIARPPGTRVLLTWDKGEHVGMGDLELPWKPNTEEIYVLGDGFVGTRTGSVLRHLAIAGGVGVARDAKGLILRGGRLHPTEKPVSLMLDLVGRCPPDRAVLDPFAGSASTGVAAMRLGRPFVGMEVDPTHFATACERLAAEEHESTVSASRGGQGALFGAK